MTFDIFDIVQFGRQRIIDINHNDFPVRLAFIQKSHDAENLDLLDLTGVTNRFTDFADIQRVVVSLGFGLGMGMTRVFPSL